MLVEAVRHIGVTVYDLDEAEEFWALLGFLPFDRGRCKGKFAKDLTGRDVKIEWVKTMGLPGTPVIELIKFTPDIGVNLHIALTVKSIAQFGVENPAVDKWGRKIKYIQWGELILELVEEK